MHQQTLTSPWNSHVSAMAPYFGLWCVLSTFIGRCMCCALICKGLHLHGAGAGTALASAQLLHCKPNIKQHCEHCGLECTTGEVGKATAIGVHLAACGLP